MNEEVLNKLRKYIDKLDKKLSSHKKFDYILNNVYYENDYYSKLLKEDGLDSEINIYDNGKELNILLVDKDNNKYCRSVSIYLDNDNLIFNDSLGLFKNKMLSLQYTVKRYDKNGIELSRDLFADYLNIDSCYSIKKGLLELYKPGIDKDSFMSPKIANHAKIINIVRDYDNLGMAEVTTISGYTSINNKSNFSNKKREVLPTNPKYPDILFTLSSPVYATYDFFSEKYYIGNDVTNTITFEDLKKDYRRIYLRALSKQSIEGENSEYYNIAAHNGRK